MKVRSTHDYPFEMKIYYCLYSIIAILVLTASCDKNDGHGTIFVKTMHDGKAVYQANAIFFSSLL